MTDVDDFGSLAIAGSRTHDQAATLKLPRQVVHLRQAHQLQQQAHSITVQESALFRTKGSSGPSNQQQQRMPVTTMSPLFYDNAFMSNTASMFPQLMTGLISPPPPIAAAAEQQALVHTFSQQNAEMQESPKGSLDSLLKSNSSSMVDSTSEMTGDEDTGHCSPTSEPMNCIPLGTIPPLTVSSMLNRTMSTSASMPTLSAMTAPPSLQHCKEFFCMQPESPAGPLSPSALQMANCSRGESEDSLGGGSPDPGATLKRQFEEEEAWIEQHMRSRKLPKLQEKALVFQDNFQDPTPPPASFDGEHPHSQFAASGGFLNNVTPNNNSAPTILNDDNSAAAGAAVASSMPQPPPFMPPASVLPDMRAILFPAPLHVPSMEEIANSRPKRRNVRISKDPQSVAARHRRERISDRIRVLQRLVPGGTKMDTASMLDEAIHYVKFLKLQLQTLEQIGNGSCEPRFMAQEGGGSLLPPVANSAAARSFDLNCAAYQAWAPTTMVHQISQAGGGGPLSHSSSTLWPSEGASPFAFPDPIQEQFCH